MTAAPGHRPVAARVRPSHVEWVEQRLSGRDWQIIEAVNRLKLVTADQLERLFFSDLSGHSRAVSRGRVLRRLVAWRVLMPLERRIGGAAGGSSGIVLALDSAGRRLMLARSAAVATVPRVRRAGAPTERTVRHTIAVAELFTGMVEAGAVHGIQVVNFEAEPGCWWPDGLGSWVKPDAYAVLAFGEVRDHWWAEADLATESLPTVRRKLHAYLDFVRRGQLGPEGIVPRVLFSTSHPGRAETVRRMVAELPDPASGLFVVTVDRHAVLRLIGCLKE